MELTETQQKDVALIKARCEEWGMSAELHEITFIGLRWTIDGGIYTMQEAHDWIVERKFVNR